MSTYKDAGVDIDAGDRAVELMKASIAKASRPEVMGGIGGFAGLFDASALKKFNKPLLATSTDGVGTKTEIARQMGIYDTIGEDLVAMVVDDLVVCGAEPLFMTDYIAVGKVVPERIADIVKGIARGCEKANTALIGGETSLSLFDGYVVATSEETTLGQEILTSRIPAPQLKSKVPGNYWQHVSYVYVWWLMALLVLFAPFYNSMKERQIVREVAVKLQHD
jgi:hypothetical protein